MTRLTIPALLLALLLPLASHATEKKPSVYVMATVASDVGFLDRSVPDQIQQALQEGLSREFKCAKVWTQKEFDAELAAERKAQLTGGGKGTAQFLDKLNTTDFLVSSSFGYVGKRPVLGATLIYLKKKEPVARIAFAADGASSGVPRLVKEFVERVAKWQLCSYNGKLDITVVTKRDGVPQVERGTRYCNGDDQAYVRTKKHTEEIVTSWSTDKIRRRYGSGQIGYSEWAQIDVEEDDPCHRCPSGRSYPRTTGSSTRVDGVMDRAWGIYEATTIDIEFADDGTYGIAVEEGSPKKGQRTEAVTKWAEGACDTFPRRTTRSPPVEFSIPLRAAPITGQKGTPFDRRLQGEGETPLPSADGETTVVRWKYDLKRD
jgi:hypothetical protein